MGRRDTLLLSILTFITALSWIAFDVYHASVESTIPKEVEELLAPITPQFDKSVIENVKKRQNVEPLESGGGVRVAPVRIPPSTAAAAARTPSPTGETATQSGGLPGQGGP